MSRAASGLILLVLALTAPSPQTWAESWARIGKNSEVEGYLDLDGLNSRSAQPYFWLLLKFTVEKQQHSSAPPYTIERNRYDVDCGSGNYRLVAVTRQTSGGAIAPTVGFSPQGWRPYSPGSFGGTAAQLACFFADFGGGGFDFGPSGPWDKEFDSQTAKILLSSSQVREGRGGLLLAKLKATLTAPQIFEGKTYASIVDHVAVDCKRMTYRPVARTMFDHSGKPIVSLARPPSGGHQEFRSSALKDYLGERCSVLEARATPVAPSSTPSPAVAQQPKQKATSTGSGFVIANDGHIVTNNHVVSQCVGIDVRLPISREHATASLKWGDKRNDIAIIKVERSLPTAAELRPMPLKAGESVVAYGFPLSGLLASDGIVSAGLVSATSGIGDDTTRVQISAPVQPGNSGGPLLDETGAVAGIVVAKLDAIRLAYVTGDIPQNINFANQVRCS